MEEAEFLTQLAAELPRPNAQERFFAAVNIWGEGLQQRALVPRDIHTGPVALLIARHNGIQLLDQPKQTTWAWAEPHKAMAYQWWGPVYNSHVKNPPPPPEWLLALGYPMHDLYMVEQAFDLCHPYSDKHSVNYYEPRFDPDITVQRLLACADCLGQLLHLPPDDLILGGQQIAAYLP